MHSCRGPQHLGPGSKSFCTFCSAAAPYPPPTTGTWTTIDSSYLVSAVGHAIPPDAQRAMSGRATRRLARAWPGLAPVSLHSHADRVRQPL